MSHIIVCILPVMSRTPPFQIIKLSMSPCQIYRSRPINLAVDPVWDSVCICETKLKKKKRKNLEPENFRLLESNYKMPSDDI